jgi:phosphopantetheine adenylyltransferase
MEALVISQETRSGGDAINEDRRSQGYDNLALVIVNLVGKGSKALNGQKLSSTALREKEAADAAGSRA